VPELQGEKPQRFSTWPGKDIPVQPLSNSNYADEWDDPPFYQNAIG